MAWTISIALIWIAANIAFIVIRDIATRGRDEH
jgi:hypothetical protein